jgi:hypothetical protein
LWQEWRFDVRGSCLVLCGLCGIAMPGTVTMADIIDVRSEAPRTDSCEESARLMAIKLLLHQSRTWTTGGAV